MYIVVENTYVYTSRSQCRNWNGSLMGVTLSRAPRAPCAMTRPRPHGRPPVSVTYRLRTQTGLRTTTRTPYADSETLRKSVRVRLAGASRTAICRICLPASATVT